MKSNTYNKSLFVDNIKQYIIYSNSIAKLILKSQRIK